MGLVMHTFILLSRFLSRSLALFKPNLSVVLHMCHCFITRLSYIQAFMSLIDCVHVCVCVLQMFTKTHTRSFICTHSHTHTHTHTHTRHTHTLPPFFTSASYVHNDLSCESIEFYLFMENTYTHYFSLFLPAYTETHAHIRTNTHTNHYANILSLLLFLSLSLSLLVLAHSRPTPRRPSTNSLMRFPEDFPH